MLDWELSTLGHPLADLAYNCMPYSLPHDGTSLNGLVGLDIEKEGIPLLDDYVAAYAKRTGRESIPGFKFFLSFFMLSPRLYLPGGLRSGQFKGNASSENAIEVGAKGTPACQYWLGDSTINVKQHPLYSRLKKVGALIHMSPPFLILLVSHSFGIQP